MEAQAKFQLFGCGLGICWAFKSIDRTGRIQVGWDGCGIWGRWVLFCWHYLQMIGFGDRGTCGFKTPKFSKCFLCMTGVSLFTSSVNYHIHFKSVRKVCAVTSKKNSKSMLCHRVNQWMVSISDFLELAWHLTFIASLPILNPGGPFPKAHAFHLQLCTSESLVKILCFFIYKLF